MAAEYSILVYRSNGVCYGIVGTNLAEIRGIVLGVGGSEEVFFVSGDDFTEVKRLMFAEARSRGIKHVVNFEDTELAAQNT